MKNKKFIKGSGIVAVIFASVVTSVYMVSTFADYEHYRVMYNKYADYIKDVYAKNVENVDSRYQELEKKVKSGENFILENSI